MELIIYLDTSAINRNPIDKMMKQIYLMNNRYSASASRTEKVAERKAYWLAIPLFYHLVSAIRKERG